MRKLALLGGFLVALASLAVACKGVPKLARVPRSPDIIIKADEAYLEGEERERDLSLKHYKALENIIAGVRNLFPVQKFEFFERQVGFFPPRKEKTAATSGSGPSRRRRSTHPPPTAISESPRCLPSTASRCWRSWSPKKR